jgi:hypothetical protein
MSNYATQKERRKMQKLAEAGNPDAIQFLKDTPRFQEYGIRVFTCRKILKDSGDEEVAGKYDRMLETRRVRHRADYTRRKAAKSKLVTVAPAPGHSDEEVSSD